VGAFEPAFALLVRGEPAWSDEPALCCAEEKEEDGWLELALDAAWMRPLARSSKALTRVGPSSLRLVRRAAALLVAGDSKGVDVRFAGKDVRRLPDGTIERLREAVMLLRGSREAWSKELAGGLSALVTDVLDGVRTSGEPSAGLLDCLSKEPRKRLSPCELRRSSSLDTRESLTSRESSNEVRSRSRSCKSTRESKKESLDRLAGSDGKRPFVAGGGRLDLASPENMPSEQPNSTQSPETR
jgi:hypothetical protein